VRTRCRARRLRWRAGEPGDHPGRSEGQTDAAAVTVLAVTITQRAGRAARVTASVPCWASPVNMRMPVTAASIATSGSG
jgi:hypothetical protein